VDVPLRRHQTARFHRGHLHSALLQHVPPELIHLNKRVTGAKVSADKVTLYFADGTSAEGDVLVGADGIHSVCYVTGDTYTVIGRPAEVYVFADSRTESESRIRAKPQVEMDRQSLCTVDIRRISGRRHRRSACGLDSLGSYSFF